MRRVGHALAVLILGLAGLLVASGPAATQAWRSNSIRIIVPLPPDGTTDQIARHVQPLLQADLEVPVIVENRAGASVDWDAGGLRKAAPAISTDPPP